MTSYRYRSDSKECKEKVNDLNQTDVKSAKIIQTVKQHVTEVQICTCSFTEFFFRLTDSRATVSPLQKPAIYSAQKSLQFWTKIPNFLTHLVQIYDTKNFWNILL